MRGSRILLLTVLVSGALYIAGFAAMGSTPPDATSSGSEIIGWFSDHGDGVRVYAWTAAFIALGLAIFCSQVAALLPKPHRYMFLIGGIGFVIETVVQAWIWAGLALHPEGLESGAARTIFDISLFWGPILNGATTTMAAAVGALGFGKSPLIPGWLTALSVIFFVEQAIETITVFGHSGFIEPGGAMNLYLGGVVGFAWGLGLTFWAFRQMQAAEARSAPV